MIVGQKIVSDGLTNPVNFGRARLPAPVLNTPHFSKVFTTPLLLCNQGFLRAVECVALKGSVCTVEKRLENHIAQVALPDYPGGPYFADERFFTLSNTPFAPPSRTLPGIEELLFLLYSKVGAPYIWGGNASQGIPEMLTLYPPKRALTAQEEILYTLSGLDCSGLLFEAAQGLTPRNTSELVHFGSEAASSSLPVEKIALQLKPLDLIVWKGHVLIAGHRNEIIESRGGRGVIVTPVLERLNEVVKSRRSDFTIRRWHPAHT